MQPSPRVDICIYYISYTPMGSKFDPDEDAANIAGERLISVRRATAKERQDYEG
jgi:uncharacterized DUF497 family protein